MSDWPKPSDDALSWCSLPKGVFQQIHVVVADGTAEPALRHCTFTWMRDSATFFFPRVHGCSHGSILQLLHPGLWNELVGTTPFFDEMYTRDVAPDVFGRVVQDDCLEFMALFRCNLRNDLEQHSNPQNIIVI